MPHPSSGARTLPVALTGGKGKESPGASFYYELFLSPLGNVLTLQAVEAAVAGEQLGRDDVPDLLCVSFSATDLVGHMFGPESVEARDTVLRFDALLAQLLEFLDRDVGAGRYAFLLSADHGVGHSPAWVKAHGGTGGNTLLHSHARAAAEKALQEHFGAAAKGPFVASALEFSLVLDRAAVTAAAAAAGNADADAAYRRACEVAAAGAMKAPHVQCAFVTEDLLAHPGGDEPVRRAMAYAACRGRSGDVMLVFEPNWIEGPIAATHGSPFDCDRQVPLLAMGPGLARGAKIAAPVSPGLMVVLAAALLGVDKPKAAVDAIPDGAMGR
jgi:predicted AlkP superfamily pyrophosphatase or phosphodiesterase